MKELGAEEGGGVVVVCGGFIATHKESEAVVEKKTVSWSE